MNKSQVKAIFFDLDETLIKNHIPVRKLFPTVFYNFVDQIGEQNKYVFFEALKSQINGLWLKMFDSDICPEQQLINCYLNSLNATKVINPGQISLLAEQMAAHFINLAAQNIQLHDGAIETLETLKKRDIKIGLITNGMVSMQMGKLGTLELENYFDTITISAEARAHKPAKAIFELALSRANVTPDQAWHVGDHIENDVSGAVKAGLHGIYYNPTHLHVENSFADVLERPHYTINSLIEIADYI